MIKINNNISTNQNMYIVREFYPKGTARSNLAARVDYKLLVAI